MDVEEERGVGNQLSSTVVERHNSIPSTNVLGCANVVSDLRFPGLGIRSQDHDLQHGEVPVMDLERELLVPVRIESIAMDGSGGDLLLVAMVTNDFNHHIGVDKIAFGLFPFGIELLTTDELHGEFRELLGSVGIGCCGRNPHVERFEYISTFSISHETTVVDPQRFSWRLYIQSSHVNAVNPSQHGIVVGRVDASTLGINTREMRAIVGKELLVVLIQVLQLVLSERKGVPDALFVMRQPRFDSRMTHLDLEVNNVR